ncbi:hypothetical protein U1Q18_026320 [Sarracenia purpurea var. burkii]
MAFEKTKSSTMEAQIWNGAGQKMEARRRSEDGTRSGSKIEARRDDGGGVAQSRQRRRRWRADGGDAERRRPDGDGEGLAELLELVNGG